MEVGTNYFWHSFEEDTRPDESPSDREERTHIGKRSAAGYYCWDCNVTLCLGGKSQIHKGHSEFSDICPKCHQPKTRKGLKDDGDPAGLELGFAKPNEERPSGVTGASSFTWAADPHFVRETCKTFADKEMIRDEYDRLFTCDQFLHMLKTQCPIEYEHMIGTHFF